VKAKAQTNYKSEADRIAAGHGGICLTPEIPTIKSKAVWKCSVPNHPEWKTSFASVKGNRTEDGTWCDRCFRERLRTALRLSIEEVRAKLRSRDIELMSQNYLGIECPIICRCLRCYQTWTTRLRHINHGHGCPECGNRKLAEQKRYPTTHFIKVLRERQITLLGVDHSSPMTRLHCRCDICGHAWRPLWNTIQGGGGCPVCGRKRTASARRLSFDFVKGYLEKQGIELLFKEYRDSRSPLHVRFPCGCEGYADFNSMQSGRRCAKCAPNARVMLEDYHQLAAIHGGSLVRMAATVNQPAKWKCHKGDYFSRPYSNIQQSGTFCPYCSEGLSERICRAAAEQLFGVPFKKTPLRDVRGVGGRPLHFDAYSETLKLAIEHNGQQHYQPSRFGNQTEADATYCFSKQQEHDRRRREFCAVNGITLIEVPELGKRTKTEDLKEFIRAECEEANFKLPDGFDRVDLKLDAHHLATTAEEMWERVLKQVRETGYTLKTANYPGANGRLLLLCRNSHEYKPIVANFLNGYTCRRCLIQQRAVPVVVLALGAKAKNSDYASARVFDTIEECAKSLGADPNNVRIVAKGRGKSCMGFGVVQITQAQAKCFRESRESLVNFCRMKWPSPETYDRQDGSRTLLSKAVVLSDGRRFPSKAAAARALGVTMAAVAFAVRKGSQCQKLRIRLAAISV
jgi:hypothetical protein